MIAIAWTQHPRCVDVSQSGGTQTLPRRGHHDEVRAVALDQAHDHLGERSGAFELEGGGSHVTMRRTPGAQYQIVRDVGAVLPAVSGFLRNGAPARPMTECDSGTISARLSSPEPAMPMESPSKPLPGLRRMVADFGEIYLANAVIAFIFAASGPVAIILAIGTRGGLSESDLSSWIFGAFFLNGLITLLFCTLYRQPLVFFWTIPGTVLVGPALGHLSWAEVIGAFLATGLLMVLLGLSGWVRRAMQAVPMPIVMGMVAGVFLRFGLGLVYAVRDDFWIAAPMIVVFLALGASAGWSRRLPPLIGALFVGAAAIALLGRFHAHGLALHALAHPNLYMPVFSWRAMVELVIPLAITVLVVQNGQGIAVLNAADHEPPVNAITVACGAGSMLAALFGTVSTCLTGPVNAIISGSGERQRHYTAGLAVGVFALAFGLFAPVFTRLMLATPPAFIGALAGLAMLRVLQTAFNVSFRERFTLGALVTFLITVADVPIFSIGAPFWGLVIGYAVSRLLERKDFGAAGA
jgi:benzoate membrane transport protein